MIAQLAYLRVLELEPGSEAAPMLVLAHEPVADVRLRHCIDVVAVVRLCHCIDAP